MTERAAEAPRSIETSIHASAFRADELLVAIKSKFAGQPMMFDMRRGPSTLRHVDQGVVVAVMAASGVVLRTFLKGLFDWISERRRQTVTLKGVRDGKEVQLVVPITASNDEIERVIALWQVMARPQIEISDEAAPTPDRKS